MSILSITWKDLQILFKDRNNLIATFLLPIIFVVVFLGVASTGGGDDEESGLLLPVVNLDSGGSAAELLLDRLESGAGILVEPIDESSARTQVEDGDIDRVLFIPAGFTADLAEGRQAELRLVNNSVNQEETESVFLSIQGVAQDMSLEQQIVASLQQMEDMQAASPQANTLSAASAIPLAREQFKQSSARPLIEIQQKFPEALEVKEEFDFGVQIAVPGFTVLFVFLTAQVTARSIYDEKKTGSFRRLLAAPIGNWRLLLGKMLPNILIIILQTLLLFATGILILPLIGMERLDLGQDLPALALLILVVALCSTALGILIAAIARTEAQIGGISSVLLWVLAFLGGSFIPLFLINEAMANLGKVTPHYWAVTGFYDLLTRGHGLSAITDSLLVLVGFTLLFFVIGSWRFDFE